MCGLTGIFHPDRLGEVDVGLLRRMNGALAHRGPDGDGFHVEPGLGLGHRRLSIVDVAGGGQPMYNERISPKPQPAAPASELPTGTDRRFELS